MKAVIMAGGQGSRLRPLTCDLPKPMVPVANRPMMEYIVELLALNGIEDIAVTTCYIPEIIEEHFRDGAPWNVRLQYFVEDQPLGTAGSVKNARSFLDGTCLVISGDSLTDLDLEGAVAYHHEKGSLATLVLTRVSSPLEYGLVFINEAGQVERFLEKPGWGEVFSDTVNTGIYILEPEALSLIPTGRQFDFSKDLFPLMLQRGEPLYGYVASGYWSDIGNLEQYVQSHIDLLEGKVRTRLSGQDQGGIWTEEGAFIHQDAVIRPPAILGRNSRVERGAVVGPHTIIGSNSVVGQQSSIKRSIVWNNVHIGNGAEVRGAVICNQAVVKPKVRIFEGAVIGQSSILGMSSTIRPGVKIWPQKLVEKSTTVTEDVVWAGTCSSSLFGNTGIVGLANVEISPEFAARVGASLGAMLDLRQAVLVAADGWEPSRMVKRALTAGVLSSGVNVVDIGSTTLPVTRFTTVLTKTKAGVYVQQGRKMSDQIEVEILDEKGFPFSRNQERALENYFYRGDFRRVPGGEVGRTQFAAGANQAYLKALCQQYGKASFGGQRLSVVIGYTSPALRFLLPPLLDELGCQVIDVAFDKEPGVAPNTALFQQDSYLSQVIDTVLREEAALGLLVGGSGRTVLVVGGEGELLSEDVYWPLLTWAFAVRGKDIGKVMAVPVTAPHSVEELAARYHLPVVRTPNNPRAVLQGADGQAEGDLTLLHPAFDALSFIAALLSLVAREGVSLEKLVASIPAKGRRELDIPVTWQEKGRVMHTLLASTVDRPRDLIDGIKVYHEQGWALVLPDGEDPMVRVYAEAPTYDEADSLAQLYLGEIEGQLR